MPGSWRSYTESERAEAVALAMTIGTKAASAQLAIPRRTLSSWLQRPSADVQAAILSTRTAVAESFWEVVDAGTKAMLAKIGDPKTRAGELAAIVKTAVESHALLTGGATARTANVNVNVDGSVQPGHDEFLAGSTPDERNELGIFLRRLIDSDDSALMEYLATDPTWAKHFGRWQLASGEADGHVLDHGEEMLIENADVR